MAATPERNVRARTVAVYSCAELDQENVLVKSEPARNGDGLYFFLDLEGMQPRLNLTPADSLKVLYGFDMQGRIEKRTFNSTEPAPRGKSESLSFTLVLTPQLSDWLEALDNRCRDEVKKLEPKLGWHPLVRTQNAKVKVVLAGEGLTNLKVARDGEMLKGSGWTWLKEQAAAVGPNCNFWGAQVKLAVKLQIYQMKGTAGITMTATQAVLKPAPYAERPAEAEEDLFPDDAEF
jgi:hypothetical protein